MEKVPDICTEIPRVYESMVNFKVCVMRKKSHEIGQSTSRVGQLDNSECSPWVRAIKSQ